MKKKDKLPISVSVVIPLYNNSGTLLGQLNTCLKILNNLCQTYEVIISNDESSDNTKNILDQNFKRRKHVIIVHQKKNLGISKNIRFLYNKAKLKYVLLYSVDGAWNAHDIGRLIKTIYKTNAGIIIGERQKKAYSFYRLSISKLYNTLPYIFFGVRTYDAGSIKILKKEVIDKISIQSKSVFFEAEMIIKAVKKGYTVGRVSIHHTLGERTKSGVNYKLLYFSLVDLLRLKLGGI